MIHTWTIAVEFQLYVATPPLFALAWFLSKKVPRASFSAIAFVLASLVWLACCVARIIFVLENGEEMVDSQNFRTPYVSTLYRMAPYAAGLCGGIAVQEYKAGCRILGVRVVQLAAAGLSTIILLLACLFGGEPMYFIQTRGGAWYGQLWQVSLVQTALHRPCIGLATSYLLVLATTGNAPRLQSFLGARAWAPLAALSYSMYLLQYAGWMVLLLPLYNNFIKERLVGRSVVEGLALAYFMPLLAVLGTLPLAILNFVFIERSSMILSKRLLARKEPPVAPDIAPSVIPETGSKGS